MAKIRDLAINGISVNRPAMWAQWGTEECRAGGSAKPPECRESSASPSRDDRDDESKRKCDNSKRPEHERKEEKYFHGLPANAVMQLKQQLQHRVSHPHN